MPLETLILALQLFGSLEEFLKNQEIQRALSDPELIDEALTKLGKNEEESARIKAKLQAMITS